MHSLPHVRGGVSPEDPEYRAWAWSSPRAWGCFRLGRAICRMVRVFPTCVGVFLIQCSEGLYRTRLPHVRGGVSCAG